MANGAVYEDIPEELSEEEEKEFRKTRRALHVHDAKIEALNDLIEELNGKPLMVVYHFKHDLKRLQMEFGKSVPRIGSGVSAGKTKELVDKWNNKDIDLLFVQASSMAHGLNMQHGGVDICWFCLPWDLELYIQLNKRVDRSGVKEKVRVHHLVAKRTIDEAILSRLGERAKVQQDLREAIRKYRLSV